MKTMHRMIAAAFVASATLATAQEPKQEPRRDDGAMPGSNKDDRKVDRDSTAVTTRFRASKLIGADIKNAAKEDLGEIDDIVLDRDSKRISYVVVSYGGVLGMGDKLFAMPFGLLTFTSRGENEEPLATLALDKETLKKSPGFDKKHWPDFANRTWSRDVDSYYSDKYNAPRVSDGVIDDKHGAAADAKGAPQDPKNKNFAHRRLSHIIGVDVKDPGNRSLGEIEDVIVNAHDGTIDGMVIGYGGVLGIGEKLVAVPCDSMTYDRAKDVFVLPSSRDRLDTVAFASNSWPKLNDDAWLDGGRAYFKKNRVDKTEGTDEAPVAFRDHYDPKKTESVSGVIRTIGTVEVGDERNDRVRLRIAADDGREVIVFAAPRTFGEQDALGLRPGQRIEVTGSRAQYGSQTVLVAGVLRPDGNSRVVRLRDDDGRPLWDMR